MWSLVCGRGPHDVELKEETQGDSIRFLQNGSSAVLCVRGHLTNEHGRSHGHGFDVLPEPMDLFVEGLAEVDLRHLAHAMIVLADQLSGHTQTKP